MKLLIALLCVILVQIGLWQMSVHGEVAFWYAVLEVITIPLSIAGLVFGWAASLDWSK